MVRVWWPKFIRKPRVRLTKPSLKMPNKPSSSTVFILTLIFVLVVFGGGIWDIVYRDRVRSLGASSTNQPVLIYPGLDSQFLIEGVVASIFIFIGFMGFIVMYQSTRHVYRPNYARLLLVSGIALVLASYILTTVMLNAKF
nr:hypothetical protein [Candidatus Njordarchaeum guaymaensis]